MKINISNYVILLIILCISILQGYSQSPRSLTDPSGYIQKYDSTFEGVGPTVYFLPEAKKKIEIMKDEFQTIHYFKDSIQQFSLHLELLNAFENTSNYNAIEHIIMIDSLTLANWPRAVDYQIVAHNEALAIGLLNEFAKQYILQKNYTNAELLLKRASDLAENNRITDNKSVLQSNLSSIYLFNNKFKEANLVEEISYEDAKRSKSITDQGRSLVKLAMIQAYNKDYTLAENTIIRKAIPLFNRAKDYNNKINAWTQLAKIYTLNKKYTEAQWFLIQAQELALQKNITNYNTLIEYMLGYAKFYQDNLQISKQELTKALALAKESGNKYVELSTTQMLGEISLKQNRIDDAETFLNSYWKLRKELF